MLNTIKTLNETRRVNQIAKLIAKEITVVNNVDADIRELEIKVRFSGDINTLAELMGKRHFNKLMQRCVNNWNKLSDAGYAVVCEHKSSEAVTRHAKMLREYSKDAKSIFKFNVA